MDIYPSRRHLLQSPLVTIAGPAQRLGEAIQITADGAMDYAIHAHLSHPSSLSRRCVRTTPG